MPKSTPWGDSDPSLQALVEEQFAIAIDVYARDQKLLAEHANQEDSFRTGGYSERQLFELVQNAADAILRGGSRGRIELRLSEDTLYCANEGAPFDESGVNAVTHAFLSEKRGEEIGRFGLGFKSILSITDNAQVFSSTVSFEFNSQRAQAAMAQVSPSAARLPQFRIPTLLDVKASMTEDPILAELSTWATTVVKMPKLRHKDRIRAQIGDFKTEFLLFANAVSSLRLVAQDGSASDFDREHRCDSYGDNVFEITSPAGDRQRWLVFENEHKPSKAARHEVGEALAREIFKITYAAPVDSPGSTGQFWAYFPLRDQTTATGLFNAPWSVSDDRTTLLRGSYNDEIYDSFCGMFVQALPRLRTIEDPAKHFDYMPSRAREVLSDGDRYLSTNIPLQASVVPMIPDAIGELTLGSELEPLSFDVTLPMEAMREWQETAHTPDSVPHFRCYQTAQRRTRLRDLFVNERLATGADEKTSQGLVTQRGLATWLSTLASSDTLADAALALEIVSALRDRTLEELAFQARIVPTTSGVRAKIADRETVFLSGELVAEDYGFAFVDPSFLELAKVRSQLTAVGFRPVDPSIEFKAVLDHASDDWSPEQWAGLWDLVDYVPGADARRMIAKHVDNELPLRVMTISGEWREPNKVIDGQSAGITIDDPRRSLDSTYASRDLARAAGVVVGVEAEFPIIEDELFQEYKAWAIGDFQKRVVSAGGIVSHQPTFSAEYGPGPISVLKDLALRSETAGQVAWSALLLQIDADRTWALSSPGSPISHAYPAPHLWAVQEYGLLHTSWGLRTAVQSLHPALSRYAGLLPVATLEGAKRLPLCDDLEKVPLVIWRELLGWSYGPTTVPSGGLQVTVDLITRAIRALPESEPILLIPAIVGNSMAARETESVRLATDAQEEAYLQKRVVPYLRIADMATAEWLAERTGAGLAANEVSFSVEIESEGDPELLVDRFVALRDLGAKSMTSAVLIRCARIAKRVTTTDGIEDEPVRSYRRNDTVYVENGVDDREILEITSRAFDLQLSGKDIEGLLKVTLDAQVEELEAACRAAATDVERLQILLTDDELESRLPAGLTTSLKRLGAPFDSETIPKLVLDVFGFDALRELKDELAARRLAVPLAWAGSVAALKFVKRIGFSSQYAGEHGSRLAPTLTIAGKPELPDLHDYQEKILASIRDIIESPIGAAKKAMLELPTGAGKTRVTVEAIIRSFLSGHLVGPVLWIAQSEELCEQAVQTWSEVWRDFSDSRTLVIGRLWSENEVPEPDSDLSVIVATDAKLDNLRDEIEYEWLSQASAVIVDEAHVAGDAPSYTRIFTWLGVDGRSNVRPLLGLSATPFKGDSRERTQRLARRFGEDLISGLGKDPYAYLQSIGVLSRVDHELLDGASLQLTESELRDAAQFSRLSASVLERIATNEDRTSRLIRHIMSLDEAWPVLVFTSSVLSAQIVAALLSANGVPAASVSGKTRRHERRRTISDFRAGRIRVLTNCDVLTQGFDAPGVRALYIARPTLSPNAYIQMAGRGLRGPLNGGSERCLIVDLADSFSNLGGELAYRKFDDLWNRIG